MREDLKYKIYPSLEDAVLTIILCENERDTRDAEGFNELLKAAWNYVEQQSLCFSEEELTEIAKRQCPGYKMPEKPDA